MCPSVCVLACEIYTRGARFVSEQMTATLRQYDYADTTEQGSHLIHFERATVRPVFSVIMPSAFIH